MLTNFERVSNLSKAPVFIKLSMVFLKKVEEDKTFKELVQTKFPLLQEEWQESLACDLYELDSTLIERIQYLSFQRDSLMLADTTVRKEESFLEQLYNRKLRQQRQQEKRDSIRRQDLISIEENDDND